MAKYTEKEKTTVLLQVQKGKSVLEISAETGIARSTIYEWQKQIDLPVNADRIKITMREVNSLKRQVEKYKNLVEILQSVDCTVFSPTKERLIALEGLYGQYDVHTLCEALKVPRGTFYNHIFRGKHGDTMNARRREELKEHILNVFNEFRQLFGAKKITAILRERGQATSEKLVYELMVEMGIQSISTSSKRAYLKWQKGENKNVLQQQFHVREPNRVWVSDITAFKFNDVYYHICAIIDLFSRKVIAYRVSKKSATQLITFTFRKAYSERQPVPGLIFHSDRGCQYTSFAFKKLLNDHQVVQSFSKSGTPHDNAVMEAFFSYLKKEELYRRKYKSEKEFLKGIDDYIEFYNKRRPHGAIHYKTPNAMEEIFYADMK